MNIIPAIASEILDGMTLGPHSMNVISSATLADAGWSFFASPWVWLPLIVMVIILLLGARTGWTEVSLRIWKIFHWKSKRRNALGATLPRTGGPKHIPADFIDDTVNGLEDASDLDRIRIPVFEVNGDNLETIVSWNRACRDFYLIPESDADSPESYTVLSLFEKDRRFYEDDAIYEEHLDKYRQYRASKEALSEFGFTFATAFYPKCSEEMSRFHARRWNRLGSIFIEKNDRGNWWVTILWVPVHEICNAKDFHSYLKSNLSGFGDKDAKK